MNWSLVFFISSLLDIVRNVLTFDSDRSLAFFSPKEIIPSSSDSRRKFLSEYERLVVELWIGECSVWISRSLLYWFITSVQTIPEGDKWLEIVSWQEDGECLVIQTWISQLTWGKTYICLENCQHSVLVLTSLWGKCLWKSVIYHKKSYWWPALFLCSPVRTLKGDIFH